MENLANSPNDRTTVEAILFDLDGTLVDSQLGIESSVITAIERVLPNVEHRFSPSLIGPPIQKIFSQSLDCPSPETLSKLEEVYREVYDNQGCLQSVLFPGVRETLTTLVNSGTKCFIVTNKPAIPTARILDSLNLSHFFALAISPDSISPRFPSKKATSEYLIQKHHLNPHRTILVGDSEDDAQAAAFCGLGFVAVSYGYGKAYLQAEYKVSQMINLLDILAQREEEIREFGTA